MFPLNDAGVWSGLLCGVLFGWVLESAGFGSPCKLTGQFKLNDWSVLKVMFTAIVVAALGLTTLQSLGLVEVDAVFVPSALLVASALGGLLIGAGFAPLVALGLSAHFGLAYVSLYLLSGAACSLAVLHLNRALEIRK